MHPQPEKKVSIDFIWNQVGQGMKYARSLLSLNICSNIHTNIASSSFLNEIVLVSCDGLVCFLDDTNGAHLELDNRTSVGRKMNQFQIKTFL